MRETVRNKRIQRNLKNNIYNLYLYHRTSRKNLKSILKHGLQTKYSDQHAIYLSTIPDFTSHFAGKNSVLLSVYAKGLRLRQPSGEFGWQYISDRNISPKRIKVGFYEKYVKV